MSHDKAALARLAQRAHNIRRFALRMGEVVAEALGRDLGPTAAPELRETSLSADQPPLRTAMRLYFT